MWLVNIFYRLIFRHKQYQDAAVPMAIYIDVTWSNLVVCFLKAVYYSMYIFKSQEFTFTHTEWEINQHYDCFLFFFSFSEKCLQLVQFAEILMCSLSEDHRKWFCMRTVGERDRQSSPSASFRISNCHLGRWFTLMVHVARNGFSFSFIYFLCWLCLLTPQTI